MARTFRDHAERFLRKRIGLSAAAAFTHRGGSLQQRQNLVPSFPDVAFPTTFVLGGGQIVVRNPHVWPGCEAGAGDRAQG